MDIVDVLLARAMTPEMTILQAEASALAAQEAAEKAASDATDAVKDAGDALETAQGLIEDLDDAMEDLEGVADAEVKKLTIAKTSSSSDANYTTIGLHTTYPDDSGADVNDLVKYYNTTGQATDGTMTQKAITDAMISDVQVNGASIVSNGVASIPISNANNMYGLYRANTMFGTQSTVLGDIGIVPATINEIKAGTNQYHPIAPNRLANAVFYGLARAARDITQSQSNNPVGTYTEEAKTAIQNMLGISGGGGGSTNLGPENAGRVVVVGSDGNIIASGIAEEEIISALIKTDTYTAKDAVGIQADYENRSYSRTQEAAEYEQGSDFNKYSMYGGRMRCNVNDNGEIVAWYGDQNYKEDGSNGQVMVYQPKFYYSRTFNKTAYNGLGDVIQKETLIISPTEQTGFKLHPLFRASDGSVLDYVLLSAYEGCAYTDSYDLNDSGNIDFSTAKLSSIAGAKPISGVNKQFTLANAEQMAQNRGSGWHVTNLAMESAQQMLQMVEYGSPNSQASLETGICYIPNNSNRNCASITGSTASLGNATGAAAATMNEINGVYTNYSDPGKRAVSYRGFENPWGNIWRMIAGINVVGSAHQNGGIPRICTDYNYSIAADATNYESIGFQLPNTYDWVSGFGVPTSKYDWVYMPIECSGGNSAVPVGDNLWTTSNLNGVNMLCCGGLWYFELSDGMFYYCCDQRANTYARSYNARLMYIPEKNTIYNNNVAAWQNKWGGGN